MNNADYIDEQKEKLNESEYPIDIATFCKKSDGYGFIAKMYSNDHNPAHIHIYNLERIEVGKLLINGTKPKTIEDLIFKDATNELNSSFKKRILDWINENEWNKKFCFWLILQDIWFYMHNNDEL